MKQQKSSLLPFVAQVAQEIEKASKEELRKKQRLLTKVSELSSRIEDFKSTQQLLK